MLQTRSRSASRRRNISDNPGNTINEMVNRTYNNQMDNMTLTLRDLKCLVCLPDLK